MEKLNLEIIEDGETVDYPGPDSLHNLCKTIISTIHYPLLTFKELEIYKIIVFFILIK